MDETYADKNLAICTYVNDIFQEFKSAREPYETKAEEWWNNFLSQYQSTKNWRIKEGEDNRSRIFLKLTQQKCYTAHAKVMDALGQDVPFNFEPLKDIDYSPMPPEVVKAAVDYRRRYISEYLKFIKFFDTLDDIVLSATVMPCAILKGPIMISDKQPVVRRRTIAGIPAEMMDSQLSPFSVTEEKIDKYIFEEVPFWDYYVDTNVRNRKRSIGEIHYKRMLKQEFRDLMDDPGYDRQQMKLAIENIENLANANNMTEDNKTGKQLGDKYEGEKPIKDNRIPVLEFQGLCPAKMIREYGSEVPENIGDEEDVEAIITIANETACIKAKFNYFGYRQFMVVGVKKIPNSVYSNSTAGLIDDSQSMVNSAARMMIDNKALSGNQCLGVNSDKIDWARTKNMKFYPRKVFYMKGGANINDVIKTLTFPDVTMGLRELVELFLRIADEESGIPKYSQGADSGSYLNKTATGISMIMGAANVNLKPFLKNIDDCIIEPVVERLDALFSMLGKYMPAANIPLKINATGTISLIAKELIVENLLKLMQITQNPQDALFIRRPEMIKEIADKLNLSDFVKNENEIRQIEQMLMAKSQQNPLEMQGRVDIDRMYPLLSRHEQVQILASIGIKPDPNYVPPLAAEAGAPQQQMPYGQ